MTALTCGSQSVGVGVAGSGCALAAVALRSATLNPLRNEVIMSLNCLLRPPRVFSYLWPLVEEGGGHFNHCWFWWFRNLQPLPVTEKINKCSNQQAQLWGKKTPQQMCCRQAEADPPNFFFFFNISKWFVSVSLIWRGERDTAVGLLTSRLTKNQAFLWHCFDSIAVKSDILCLFVFQIIASRSEDYVGFNRIIVPPRVTLTVCLSTR